MTVFSLTRARMPAQGHAPHRRRLAAAAALIAVATLLMPPPPASALANVNDDASLRAAFSNAAEDHIILDADITLDCAGGRLSRASATALLIDGGGHTIHQPCADERVMELTGGGALTLSNVTISGGNTLEDGAGVHTDGPLTIQGSTFVDNQTGGSGGAVRALSGGTVVTDSHFENNVANDFGGALEVRDTTISGSTFVLNRGHDGGAVFSGDDVTVTGSTFLENEASGEGGAIAGNGDLVVSATTFDDNHAQWGGAILYSDEITIEAGTVFIRNTAFEDGGAIYNANGVPLTVTGATFTLNEAGQDGGAIFAGDTPPGLVSISGSEFVTNTAAAQGGAIHTSRDLIVSASSFTDNSALNSAGGAIATFGDATIQGDSTFENNRAPTSTGGAVAGLQTVTIVGGTFHDNQAGAGGAVAGNALEVQGVRFTSNRAGNSGGAVVASTSSIDTSTFVDNRAADGGALAATIAVIRGSTFTENLVGDSGGAIVAQNLEIETSTLTGNEAVAVGGAIVAVDGLTLRTSTLAGNIAGDGGGAIIATGDVEVVNATLTGNEAHGPHGGGAIGVEGGDVTLVHTTVANNSGLSQILVRPGDRLRSTASVVADAAGGADCDVAATTSRFSMDGDGTCGFTDATDLPSGAPQLGALAGNGGPTPTLLPAMTSPLLEVIPETECTLATDQRGEPRPLGSGCDIGAVEVAGLAPAADDGPDAPGARAGTDAIPVGAVGEAGSLPDTGAAEIPALALLAVALLAVGTALVRSPAGRPAAPPRGPDGG